MATGQTVEFEGGAARPSFFSRGQTRSKEDLQRLNGGPEAGPSRRGSNSDEGPDSKRSGPSRKGSSSDEGSDSKRSERSDAQLEGVEAKLNVIRQTHQAISAGIEAAQDNMVKRLQEQEAQYVRMFKARAQEIMDQAKKLQKSQKPPVQISTLHSMLTNSLRAAEETARHFADLNDDLSRRNAELRKENAVLKEQNALLMRQKVLAKRQEQGTLRESQRAEPLQQSPEVSPRFLGPPLTPRTVAKVKAKIRQATLTKDYERDLKMRAELGRLREICKSQRHQIAVLKGSDGGRAELETLLQQCLLDVKARIAGQRRTSRGSWSEATILKKVGYKSIQLSTADREEVLTKLLKTERILKLLQQILSSADPPASLDFSWLATDKAELY